MRSLLRRGPRKQRPTGLPEARVDSHKTRSVWFQAKSAWPFREAPVHALVRERERAAAALADAPGEAQWESIGPSNIGGRMTSAACHPQFPERVWAGAAGGGVWFSPDAGQSWRGLWHDQAVLNVGSLAIHPTNPDILYCGTGEANLSADSYPGVGIYQTTDAGTNWQLLAAADTTGIARRIGCIAIDPFDPQHLRIGGVGHQFDDRADQPNLGGIYVSRDGGITWTREDFVSVQNYWCHSIVFHPAQAGRLFAAVTEQGSHSGIWRSDNGGNQWTQVTGGLPDAPRFGRATLAISAANPDVMYALAEDQASGRQDLLLGLFRSENGGANWTDISGDEFRKEKQMSYGNSLAIDPQNPNRVICGGVDLHLTTDGGQNWTQVTRWDVQRGRPNYAHADHHALLMPAAAPGRVYDMNDGGMDVSEDGGRTWVNRSNGLAATMFYDMDVAQSDSKNFGGGAQDNGTIVTITGRSDDYFEINGGDGGWMVYDPRDAGHLYSSSQFMNIARFRSDTGWQDVSPPATPKELERVWMVYIVMDPSNSKVVFTGSTRVWRTKNDGNRWKPVSPVLDGSPISAIEVAPADPRRIYVGTENGGIFRSRDGGDHWSANLAGATLPGFVVTRLTSGPRDANLLFASVANFGHSHIFRSADGGMTWEDIDAGRLPDVPHHAIAIHPDDPQTMYVANDAGVFVSPDLGTTWQNLTRNLPNVMVVDLVCHGRDRTLSAATYGRSLWRIRI